MSQSEGQTNGWKPRARSLNYDIYRLTFLKTLIHSFIWQMSKPLSWALHCCSGWGCSSEDPKWLPSWNLGSTAACRCHWPPVSWPIISIDAILHYHINSISIKIFCLYIPLGSWIFLLLCCPQHHPAQGLAPCRCWIKTIDLNISEQGTEGRELGFLSSKNLAGKSGHTYGSCQLLYKQELACVTHRTRTDTYLLIGLPSKFSSQSSPFLQNLVIWSIK